MRILVIEPDSATAQTIELMLRSEGFNVYTTDLGEEGVDLGKIYDYDIITLELELPDMSGIDVLRTLRVAKVNTPIMILSRCSEIDTKVKTFCGGADDYMTKPFHKDEMVARIHAIVRRSKGHAQSVIKTGNVIVNLDSKLVEANGSKVHLTGKESQMLELLSLRKGTTLTKEMFLNHLYGGMDEPELKIVDVFICKLRKKLGALNGGTHYIETVWGRGYVLRDPAESKSLHSAAPTEAAAPDAQSTQGPEAVSTEITPAYPSRRGELKDLIIETLRVHGLTPFAGLRVGDGRWSDGSIRSALQELKESGEIVNKGVHKAALYALAEPQNQEEAAA